MATDPLFTVSFDLASGDDDYGAFIAGIRDRLGNPRHVSYGRPVLPPVEPGAPRRWFHVRLSTPASALTLATRADTLYLAGFQSADGTWWELSRGTSTFLPRRRGGLIPGAASLGFAGSYRDLVGGAREASNVALGRRQMTEAVDALARLAPAPAAGAAEAEQRRRLAKGALAVLRLMVHEAARFQDVEAVVAGLMRPGAAAESGRMTRTCKSPDLDWAYWSDLLLRADSLPSGGGSMRGQGSLAPTDHLDKERVAWGAATVGILLFSNVDNGIKPKKALHLFHGSLCGKGKDGAGPDVTFIVSGEHIPAHRYVLAGKSAVFLRQFVGHRGQNQKTGPHVEVKDMDAASFTAMIHYIYTDTVPQFERRRRTGPEEEAAVAVMAHHLLGAAHRYGLDRLKLICERELESGEIYVDMAARTLALAELHDYGRLKEKCIDFIVGTPATLRAVLATEGYKELEATCPSVLTELLKSVHGREK